MCYISAVRIVCGGSKTSNMLNIAPQDAVPAYNRLRAAQRPCLHARAATGQNSNKFPKNNSMHARRQGKKKGYTSTHKNTCNRECCVHTAGIPNFSTSSPLGWITFLGGTAPLFANVDRVRSRIFGNKPEVKLP